MKNLTLKAFALATTIANPVLADVAVGAFSVKSNADNFAQKLINDHGFDAYIIKTGKLSSVFVDGDIDEVRKVVKDAYPSKQTRPVSTPKPTALIGDVEITDGKQNEVVIEEYTNDQSGNGCISVVDFIASWEGFAQTAYEDGGQYSVGFGLGKIIDEKTGNWRSVLPGDRISKEDAKAQLIMRVAEDRVRVYHYLRGDNPAGTDYNPTAEQLDALTSFAYNLGHGTPSVKKGIHQLTDNGNRTWDQIYDRMAWYVKGPTPAHTEGLKQRRLAEIEYAQSGFKTACAFNLDQLQHAIVQTNKSAAFTAESLKKHLVTLSVGVTYENTYNYQGVLGNVKIEDRWQSVNGRDYGVNSAGITIDENGARLTVDAQYTRVNEKNDFSVNVGIDHEGQVNAGFKGFVDLHEDANSGTSIGVVGGFVDGTFGVGPAFEHVGKDRGLMFTATDIAVVVRTGENGEYRKRYSLNPIAIILTELMGGVSALDVLAEPTE
jgi:GH24 family phage-related lysozyme (muramidase)